MSERVNDTAMHRFLANLRAVPANLRDSVVRGGAPRTDRTRSSFVFGNVFLHLHAVRTHRWSLRWSTTMGLGILTLAAFLITLVTGVLLMFYYKPYPDVAYLSIKDIHFVVPTGRFIRNIHRWAANVMVVGVLLHMTRVFFTGAYRKPREFNWLIGMGLLVITLALSFTGYLLPWDQLAYWAVTVGTNVAGYTPIFGDVVQRVLLGAPEIGEKTLLRFYVLHVYALPGLLTLLLGVHIWRVRKDGFAGDSGPGDPGASREEPVATAIEGGGDGPAD